MIFRIRKDPNNPYVMVNKQFVYDSHLSAKAKGILLYLLSRPDDWQVYEIEIIKHFKDGRDSIRAGVNELRKTGYIIRIRERDQKGRLGKMRYEVFEIPQQVSKDGFSNVGESNTTNIELTNIDDNLSRQYWDERIMEEKAAQRDHDLHNLNNLPVEDGTRH